MKFIITENRIYDVMVLYLERNYPSLAIEKPLKQKLRSVLANSGYGSQMDDYYKITISYIDEDEVTWFKEYDNRDSNENSKWEVNEDLENMFEIFGLENFQNFVKQYFKLDITEKGNKQWDWVFR